MQNIQSASHKSDHSSPFFPPNTGSSLPPSVIQVMDLTFHTFFNVPGELGGAIVPQQLYVSPGDFEPGQTIQFSHNGEVGIPMTVALHSCTKCVKGCTGLEEGSTSPAIVPGKSRVSLRVNWPGCLPWTEAINIQTTANGHPVTVTKDKLAYVVAKAMQKFYTTYHRSRDWPANGQWTPDVIEFHNLVLYELRHVSKGSYQPVFLYRPV